MRKGSIAVTMTLLMIVIGCSTQKMATISGDITFGGDVTVDSVYVGIYRPHADFGLVNPDQIKRQTEHQFSFDVEPGKYTVKVFSPGFETAHIHVVAEDVESNIQMQVHLTPMSLDLPIESVRLTGQFNEWRPKKEDHLIKKGDVWVFEDKERIGKGTHYKFSVNRMHYYNPNLRDHLIAGIRMGHFHHAYQGEDIIFDPAWFVQPRKMPEITVQGFDHHIQFGNMQKDFKDFDNMMYAPYRQKTRPTPETLKAHFTTLTKKLDSLEQTYDPYFAQLFLEKRIGLNLRLNPTRSEVWSLFRQKPDSATMTAYVKGEAFSQYFNQLIQWTEDLDPTSVLLDGRYDDLVMTIDYLHKYIPSVKETFTLPDNFAENYMLDCVEKAPNNNIAGNLLFSLARRYADSDKEEDKKKAETWILKLKKDYPDNWYVTKGVADKELASMKMSEGATAPLFAVKTLDGDSIKLADCKGKFVMLDFWGSWCGPCRGEVPNFKKLHTELQGDTFQFVGIARDDSASLTKFIKEQKIEYPNAIATDEILNAYGVTGFPTTFLVDPKGKILAKNLRGEKVVEMVKEKIEEYNKDKSAG